MKVDKIVSENNEIKELKQKIQQAYLNKERAKQMADKQVRKVDDLVIHPYILDQWGSIWSWNDKKDGIIKEKAKRRWRVESTEKVGRKISFKKQMV